MELEKRLTALEKRLAALELAEQPEKTARSRAAAPGAVSDFWALEGLRAELAGSGPSAGGVLFTGSVRLPVHGADAPSEGDDARQTYEWQYGMPADALLEADWTEAAESFAALGHAVRMRLLREVLGGRQTVAELAALEDLGTTGQIYHHVRQLTSVGWLHTAGRGRYEVPPGRVIPLLVALVASRPHPPGT